jgi:hypothetical protein
VRNKFFAFIIPLLIIVFMIHNGNTYAIDQPSIEFSVQPSSKEYVKPANADAEGKLDFQIMPMGKATNEERNPIDVTFVHDTSGSMADSYGGVKKATAAENALKESIKFFEQNAQSQDHYNFVPFDSDISYKQYKDRVVEPTTGLNNIKRMAENLDFSEQSCFWFFCGKNYDFSLGGTNYSQSLEYALSQFSGMNKSKRYIVFLTDGEPTSLFLNNKEYSLYTNGTASIGNRSSNYKETQKTIQDQSLLTADLLGKNNVTMYSLAFADKGDVNYQLLDSMSKKTGGFAVPANSENLTNLFKDISEQFNAPAIEGEVLIDLTKFNHKVKLANNADAYIDDQNVVHLKYNFSYPIGKEPVPNIKQLSLPLLFTEKGEYNFDNITLKYKNFKGVEQAPILHPPVKIKIVDEAAPKFENTVQLIGNKYHSPDSLVKEGMANSENNRFSIQYKLSPTGVIQANKSGSLQNLKIIQPLPLGVSLLNTSIQTSGGVADVKQITSNGVPSLAISLSQSIAYTGNNFSIKDLSLTVDLQADWAMSYVNMPRATINYTDSNFHEQAHTLNVPTEFIGLKVMLKSLSDNMIYIGDYSGKIQKTNQSSGELIAESSPKSIPVQGLALTSDGKAISVLYNDGTKSILPLMADFHFINRTTGVELSPYKETNGPVDIQVNTLVAGQNVIYEYRITNSEATSEWKTFNPQQNISIPDNYIGNVDVEVRTKGGFTLSETPIMKSIKIVKKVQSFSVTPNPITVDIGKSIPFSVSVSPNDATNKGFTLSVEGKNASLLDTKDGILGLAEGDAVLVVNSIDGSGVSLRVLIKVKNPYISLENLRFKKAKESILLHSDDLQIDDYLIYNPFEATNKKLDSVISGSNKIIDIKKVDGKWYLVPKKIGFTTITVTSDQDPKLTDTAVFEVVSTTDSGSNGDGSIDGKW